MTDYIDECVYTLIDQMSNNLTLAAETDRLPTYIVQRTAEESRNIGIHPVTRLLTK